MFGRRGGWGSGQLGAAIEFFRIFQHVRFSFFFFFFSVKSPLLGLGNCSNLIKYPPLCSTKPLSRPFLLVPQEKPLKYKKANHFLTSFAMLALFPSFFSETFKGHGVFITFFDRSINPLNMTSHQQVPTFQVVDQCNNSINN